MMVRIFITLLSALILTSSLQAAEVDSSQNVQRKYEINEAIISRVPGQGIEAYDKHGSGMATDQGSVGHQILIDGLLVEVDVHPRLEKERFLVTVELKPDSAKRTLGFENQTFEMTDLTPRAIRFATSKTGRVYQILITPNVQITDNTPRKLDVNNFKLQDWRFQDSPVLVNDALYVGRINCAHSPMAFVDITGVARVEFSLYELSDAKPWGKFNRGVVTLANPEDHTTIQISNVSNGGPAAVDLPGGPYRVWVRWSKPTYTLEQYRQEMLKQRKKILDGGIPNASTDYLDKQLAREPSPWLSSSGIRGLKLGEQVDETKGKTQ